jgi:hypothetical protein
MARKQFHVKIFKWNNEGILEIKRHIFYTHLHTMEFVDQIKNDQSRYDYIKVYHGIPSSEGSVELMHIVSPESNDELYA